MNLDKKLELAHEMAIAMIKSNDGYTVGGAVVCAWEYADAMEAEYNKCKKAEKENSVANDKELFK